eukprot:TRINITY_DN701_c0_g4_i1.p1 TRINITY_DN701_c0_g4~~TRINITY_DN701_c0_g4_i1.p1  ORF type:complete len:292 (+),score=32.36 TRINITY_DN701_c0_g4_i1:2-877(+)
MNEDTDSNLSETVQWPAKNRIYCGKFITGPDKIAFWAGVLLSVIPSLIFMAFVCGPLWMVSPLFFVGGLVTLVPIIVFDFLCAFTDPGIIPRNASERDLEEDEDVQTKEQLVVVKGFRVPLQYCRTCQIWRPPRTHHCKICDCCVVGFDHHCTWVGNCVGQRNYKYFVFFIWSVLIADAYMMSVCSYQIFLEVSHGTAFTTVVFSTSAIAPTILVVYGFIALLSVVGMCCYHCFLMASGKTTYEHVKDKTVEAWNEGCIWNYYNILCTKPSSSLLDLTLYDSHHKEYFRIS